jgi:hypothetical protein
LLIGEQANQGGSNGRRLAALSAVIATYNAGMASLVQVR